MKIKLKIGLSVFTLGYLTYNEFLRDYKNEVYYGEQLEKYKKFENNWSFFKPTSYLLSPLL